MAAAQKLSEFETGTMARAPLITPEDFDTWKIRIAGFIKYQDTRMWKSVLEGPYSPKVISPTGSGVMIPKAFADYSEEDLKRVELDARAMTVLQMSIPNSIMKGFKKHRTAKDLWDALCLTYEGSADSKENKKDIYKQMFENFHHVSGETMTQQYFRYVELVDNLLGMEVRIENRDMLRKFMGSLPGQWDMYTIAIKRSEDLNSLKLSELFGILSGYQLEMDIKSASKGSSSYAASSALLSGECLRISQQHQTAAPSLYEPSLSFPLITYPESPAAPRHEVPPQAGAFISDESMGNFMFLPEDLDCFHPDDLEYMVIIEQFALLSHRARKFASRTGRRFPANMSTARFGLDKTKVKCFNCNQMGHFARECRAPRTNHGAPHANHHVGQSSNQAESHQAAIAHEQSIDWSFQVEEIQPNLALMAHSEEDKVNDDLCTPSCIAKVKMYRDHNEEMRSGIESLNVLKADFKRAENSYKSKIDDLNKTVSLLKHEATNYVTQIKDLVSQLSEAKTQLAAAEAKAVKYSLEESSFKNMLSSTLQSKVCYQNRQGLGSNEIAPPHTYQSIKQPRCGVSEVALPPVDPSEDIVFKPTEVAEKSVKGVKVKSKAQKTDSLSTNEVEVQPVLSPSSRKNLIKASKKKAKLAGEAKVKIDPRQKKVFLSAGFLIQNQSDQSESSSTRGNHLVQSLRKKEEEKKMPASFKSADHSQARRRNEEDLAEQIKVAQRKLSKIRSSSCATKEKEAEDLAAEIKIMQRILAKSKLKLSALPKEKSIECVMCGQSDHYAKDCFYNPKSTLHAKDANLGRKEKLLVEDTRTALGRLKVSKGKKQMKASSEAKLPSEARNTSEAILSSEDKSASEASSRPNVKDSSEAK